MVNRYRLRDLGRSDPFRCVYVGGTFDCLHRGHLALFAYARSIAHRVVVGLNTDAFATRYKRRPLMGLADRMAVLDACRLVDGVVVNSGDEDSRPAVLKAQADAILHGSDWYGDRLLAQMGMTHDWLEAHGIILVTAPYTPWISTSHILSAWSRA